MAEIRPFAGLRYNQSIVKDISTTICPPYDVISAALHADLKLRNDYNFIRLEDADTSPADNAANNKYTRTADTLALWLETKVLVPEKNTGHLHRRPLFFIYTGKTECGGASSRASGWKNGTR